MTNGIVKFLAFGVHQPRKKQEHILGPTSVDKLSETKPLNYFDRKLARLRIPHEILKTATNNFAEENLIKQGKNSDVYKGVLPLSSKKLIRDVVIRKYHTNLPFDHFYKVIKDISPKHKHRNVISFIGFCDEGDERMIVMERVANGSLDEYLSDTTTLTWLHRLKICFDAAFVLEHRIISDGFRSSYAKGIKILLDKDWEAKFEISIESESLGKIDYKYYVYRLGVILLEVLYGRKVTNEDVNHYLTQIRKSQYKVGLPKVYFEQVLDDVIDPILRKQMLPESLSLFLESAYMYLKEPPYLLHIVHRLKEAFDIQWKHENFVSAFNVQISKPICQVTCQT